MSHVDGVRPDTGQTQVSEKPSSEPKKESVSDKNAAEKGSTASEVKPPKKSFVDRCPAWAAMHLRNPASWKLLARCWLASWAAVVVLLPQTSLNVLGNT